MTIVVNSDLPTEYSSHKPRASVALRSANRLETIRRRPPIILLHFIREDFLPTVNLYGYPTRKYEKAADDNI